MNNNVKKITEGAMMLAIVGIVLVINRQFSDLLTIYFYWALSLPVVVYVAKYGVLKGFVLCASIFFLALMISTPQTYFYMFSACACGIVYGGGINKKRSNRYLLLSSITLAIIANLITTILFASFFGYDIISEGLIYAQAIEELGVQLNLSFAMDIKSIILVLVILMTLLSGLLEGIIIHLISNTILKRLKIEVYSLKPLFMIKLPKWMSLVCLISLAVLVASLTLPMNHFFQQSLMALGCCGILVLLADGWLTALTYGARHKYRLLGFVVTLAMFLFASIVVPILMILGLADILLNLRK